MSLNGSPISNRVASSHDAVVINHKHLQPKPSLAVAMPKNGAAAAAAARPRVVTKLEKSRFDVFIKMKEKAKDTLAKLKSELVTPPQKPAPKNKPVPKPPKRELGQGENELMESGAAAPQPAAKPAAAQDGDADNYYELDY